MTREKKNLCGCTTMIVLIIAVYGLIHAYLPGLDFGQITLAAGLPILLLSVAMYVFLGDFGSEEWEAAARRERERRAQEDQEAAERRERERRAREDREAAERRERERRAWEKRFLCYVFSMLAKLAKADGRVDEEEVTLADKVFAHFDFANQHHQFCANVFNSAKDNARSIYWYAEQFGKQVAEPDICTFLYELLWDVACADGWLHWNQKEILQKICPYLHVPDAYYHINYRRRRGTFNEGDKYASGQSASHEGGSGKKPPHDWRHPYVSGKSSILEAYAILECEVTDTADVLRSAYHRIAKRYHPDLLRANGESDEAIAEATTRMMQVNAAWEDICKSKGI